MAKKQTSKKLGTKRRRSPTPRGEGASDSQTQEAVIDSVGEKNLPMQKPIGEYYDGPLTDEIHQQIMAAYRPVGELTEEDREARKQLLKRMKAFIQERLSPPAKRPDEVLRESFAGTDQAALSWIVSRSVDREFRRKLDEVMLKLIDLGNLFAGSAVSAVIAIVNHQLNEAVAPPQPSVGAFHMQEGGPKWAQQQLARIVMQFVPGKQVNPKHVATWIREECKRPHFKAEVAALYRQSKPHNRAQFLFMVACLEEFDREIARLWNQCGPLEGSAGDFPPQRSAANRHIGKIAQRDSALATSINGVLDHIEPIQRASRFALGLPWSNAWVGMRQNDHERVLELLEPFMHARFEASKSKRPSPLLGSNLQKQPWRIAWRPLANCLRTIMDEWPFPPLNSSLPGAKRMIEKHSQRP